MTAGLQVGQPVQAAGLAEPQATIVAAEGNDFATRVLADPWDMNALSDVSIWLNRSGQSYDTENITVANGVFSARSRTNDANFTVLFPGYEDMIKTGNMGALKPINSSTYHCLYTAMYVEGGAAPSFAQPIWFATDKLNSGTWGQSYWQTPGTWILQKLDLASAPSTGPASWTSSATWQGLRIDPTTEAGRDFEVDWVRLTDCAAVNVTVHWGGNSSIKSIWLRPSGTSRNILIKGSGVVGDSGHADIDVQGVQPGTYEVWAAAEKEMVRAMLSESLRAVISQTLLKRIGGGRIAAHEIMIGTPAIRNLIREGKIAQMYSAIQTGQAAGMQTLDQCLKELLQKGLITKEEARFRAQNKEEF